jgi:hypothetical protein
MLKQFYEKALPAMEGGMYCIGTLDRKREKPYNWKHHWVNSLEEMFHKVDELKSTNELDVYAALGVFPGPKRDADTCAYMKCVFLDIDVGAAAVASHQGYATQEEALVALHDLLEKAALPTPFIVDSGVGVHAYWVFEKQIPKHEFIPYAKLFRDLCKQYLYFDKGANAVDVARCMRWVDSINYSETPPRPTKVLHGELHLYDFNDFKEFLGEPELDTKEILASASKGLDEDTRALLQRDNYERSFQLLAEKSLDGVGCQQVANILINSKELIEPLWWAGLSIAKFCGDGEEAIHKMSEDYDGYSPEETKQKTERLDAPRTCKWFIENYPDFCDGCHHRGKITSPISLARVFKPAPPSNASDPVRTDTNSKAVQSFPNALFPFMRGENGGIYYQPPPKIDKKGKQIPQDAELIFPYDFYPVRRVYSPHDGECILMHVQLPQDPLRVFLLPMKIVYSQENFRSILTYNGVLFSHSQTQTIMNYVIKWGQYMQTAGQAEVMRMQMGWTSNIHDDDWPKRSFVIGPREVNHKGDLIDAPVSPFVKSLAKIIHPRGTLDRWKESVRFLNQPGFELHAFGMLCGFGSPLMCYTSTSGVTVSLVGKSGVAKTGALYSALSIWGNPKEMSVFDSTDNGFTGRYLALRNILFGLDESSNREGKAMSDIIHKVSHGKTKIRMQASVNAEREYEMSASLIALITTNQGIYSKLESFKKNPDGEAARLMEFLLTKPPALQQLDGDKLGRFIFDAFNFNYGHAGPIFIQQVLKWGDERIREVQNKWLDRFSQDFSNDPAYRFYANGVASNMTGGEIAQEAGLIELDLDRVYSRVVEELVKIRDTVLPINRSDYGSVVSEYVNKNLNSILVIHEGRVIREPRNQLIARISVDEGLLQISKNELKRHLQECQISAREFEETMRKNGLLIDDKKGRLTTGWRGGFGTDPVYLYWFKTTIPEEWISGPTADS